MPFDKNSAISHIQSTVNLLHQIELWEEHAMLAAMKHELHGSKRENRHESGVDNKIRKFIQTETMDLFDTEVIPVHTNMKFPETSSSLDYLKEYLKGLWDIYAKLHNHANQFVSPLLLRHYAAPLYERCECIKKSIVRTSRSIKRFDYVSSVGTAAHDLYRTNCADESLHDDFESAEKAHGYDF